MLCDEEQREYNGYHKGDFDSRLSISPRPMRREPPHLRDESSVIEGARHSVRVYYGVRCQVSAVDTVKLFISQCTSTCESRHTLNVMIDYNESSSFVVL